MAIYYSQPKLKSLTQGSRIAFIRQIRRMSQQTLGEKIGLSKDHVRACICRYERNDRDIKPDRLRKIAKVLDVDIRMIERWDFRDPGQLYHMMLWVEELCPDVLLRNNMTTVPANDTHRTFNEKYKEWRMMKTKYVKGYITYDEYLDWKLGKYTEEPS